MVVAKKQRAIRRPQSRVIANADFGFCRTFLALNLVRRLRFKNEIKMDSLRVRKDSLLPLKNSELRVIKTAGFVDVAPLMCY